jgi:hypothetical protein
MEPLHVNENSEKMTDKIKKLFALSKSPNANVSTGSKGEKPGPGFWRGK